MSNAFDIAIVTNLGNGRNNRNNINVLSCDLAIACGIGFRDSLRSYFGVEK
jgi:hypothetical protein